MCNEFGDFSHYLNIFEVQTIFVLPALTYVLISLKYGLFLAHYLGQNPYIFSVQFMFHYWTPFESTQNMNFSS